MNYKTLSFADRCGAYDHHRPHQYQVLLKGSAKEDKVCPGFVTLRNDQVNPDVEGGYQIPVVRCHEFRLHPAHLTDRMEFCPEEPREWGWCNGISAETTHHIGRSWDEARHCEDNCPCPQELCGLVDRAKVLDSCNQHPVGAVKTIRQTHEAKDCPGVRPDGEANPTKEFE